MALAVDVPAATPKEHRSFGRRPIVGGFSKTRYSSSGGIAVGRHGGEQHGLREELKDHKGKGKRDKGGKEEQKGKREKDK